MDIRDITALVVGFEPLTCKICYDVCIPPVYGCLNGHLLCQGCFISNGEKSCFCGLPYQPSRLANEILNNLKIDCPNKPKGCQVQSNIQYIQNHFNKCSLSSLSCAVCDFTCDIAIELKHHIDQRHLEIMLSIRFDLPAVFPRLRRGTYVLKIRFSGTLFLLFFLGTSLHVESVEDAGCGSSYHAAVSTSDREGPQWSLSSKTPKYLRNSSTEERLLLPPSTEGLTMDLQLTISRPIREKGTKLLKKR